MYKKPELKSYSTIDLLEKIGPCQNQYSTTLYSTTLYSIAGTSGYNIDGEVASGGGANAFESTFSIGDGNPGEITRALVGFNLSSIPATSTIVSATLRIYQQSVTGSYANYPIRNAIRAGEVDFGNSIEAGDYSISASDIGGISTDADIEWKTLGVASNVQSRLSNGYIQFRLSGNENILAGDGADEALFSSADSGSNGPELVVTYQ